MKNNTEIFICECHSTEHQMVFYKSENEIAGMKIPALYVHVHLNKKPWLERITYAIRYILGRQCRFGAFDEFMFNPDDAEKLQEVVNYLKYKNEQK